MSPRDPLAAEIAALLAPILAPAAEKADLLIEEMCARHKTCEAFEARGLPAAIKRLRTRHTPAQIRAAAKSLMARLAREHDPRERVT